MNVCVLAVAEAPPRSELLLVLVAFAALVGLLVLLRVRTNSRFEVKPLDIVLALIPIALWFFMTGRVKSLSLGELTIESAFEQASQAPVEAEVSTLPVDGVKSDAKEALGAIPRLIANRSEALTFTLGTGYYVGSAIEEYLRELTRFPFLKYLLILDAQGGFWGLADAREAAALMQGRQLDANGLARWLNDADTAALQQQLPGLRLRADSLPPTASRSEALARMDVLDFDVLPVVNDAGTFQGLVQRGRLSASLLVDIAKRLERQPP